MKNRNVQIPYELFYQLLQYFLMENYEGEDSIRKGLEKKLNAMVDRELYSKYKTAPTEEEREESRQEYLERKGIPESFRWYGFLLITLEQERATHLYVADKEKVGKVQTRGCGLPDRLLMSYWV